MRAGTADGELSRSATRLLPDAHHQRAGQSALLIDERCIVGGASLAEQRDFSYIGAFLNQSRVSRVVAIKLGAVCGFPCFRQERGVHANEVDAAPNLGPPEVLAMQGR